MSFPHLSFVSQASHNSISSSVTKIYASTGPKGETMTKVSVPK